MKLQEHLHYILNKILRFTFHHEIKEKVLKGVIIQIHDYVPLGLFERYNQKKWLKQANYPRILQTKYCPKITGICLK